MPLILSFTVESFWTNGTNKLVDAGMLRLMISMLLRTFEHFATNVTREPAPFMPPDVKVEI